MNELLKNDLTRKEQENDRRKRDLQRRSSKA